MSLVRKEDASKIVGLVGGIVVVFGFLIFRVTSASSAAKPPLGDPLPALTVVTAVPPSIVASAGGDEDIEVRPGPASSTPNPFRDITKSHGTGANPVPQPTTSLSDPDTWKETPNAPNPPKTLGGKFEPLPTVGPDAETIEPIILVTGVIPGKNAVAVVQVGSDSYVVHRNEPFGDGMSLESIDSTQVRLRHRGKTITLPVGD